ncbi:mitochondrial 2-oxodicarboxylate carrier-like isoform X1 [Penaeus chinensis]|uniref:mitochondrial 2-oxodicarboxylate carrier-like isoform X1 n=2 Tax=Penaeus chinensis TaxID=139456 RepID=UPI001FB7E6DB|nr:mitochondrial 2-oxodicarboxylate carrier-like isoform X1 [Penaeus chinensis]XP_047480816.1 mitochondrial 2-oxodicarboxylate carrier-like isoform X1 [Penaeus chinensis]
MGNEKQSALSLKVVGINLASGGSAGFTEICIMHPLDVVKTRFQIQTKGVPADPNYYTSVYDCMRKMARNEGILSLYKGVLPPVLVETPKRAVKFLTFEIYKQLFDKPTPAAFFLAGLGSGTTEAILVNPFEVVKVAQQANRAQHKTSPGTWAVAREIVRTQGLGFRGLNKGVTATIGRNGLFNMVYFGLFHTVNTRIEQPKEKWQQNVQKFFIGLVAGVLGCFVNIPFDVAKSRIQGPQPVPGEIKYRTTFGAIATVYREEGFLALYKGIVPKVLRLGPGAGIMMIVYENVHGYLTKRFPDE